VPTVKRIRSFRFFFYSNEGSEPVHIHVEDNGRAAKFWLAPVGLAWSSGYNASELRQLRQIVEDHQTEFQVSWHEHFS
jgi:hypothetical protein